MLPSWITVCALLALGAHIALLGFLLLGRDAQLDAKALSAEIGKLLGEDQAGRAVEQCRKLPPLTPAREILLFLIGLELPARKTAAGEGVYRTAPTVERFEDTVGEVVAAELARVRATVRVCALKAIGSGLVAGFAGAAALLSGTDRWGAATLSIATTGLGGAIFGFILARNLLVAPRVLCDQILPLLKPVEQMSEDRRKAAAAARSALREPPVHVSEVPAVAAALGAVVLAVWIAMIAR